jgi:hypothetical protein
LWEWLYVQEKELNKWENNLLAREDDVMAAERALGRARMECNAERDWVEAIQQDNQARLHTSTAG